MKEYNLEELGLNYDIIEEKILLDAEHPSLYINEKSHKILVFKSLLIKDNSLIGKSNYFIILDNGVYKLNRKELTFAKLQQGILDLIKIVQSSHKKHFHLIDTYTDEIDSIEDMLYDRNIPRHFMDIWFDLKKDFNKIERYLVRNIKVMEDFSLSIKDDQEVLSDFEYLIYSVKINSATSHNQIERLDNLHHYYEAIKNDKINKNIYALTLMSAIFLPLNLIVGFFGMNTEGLFFKEHPGGTIYVTLILLSVFIVLGIGLPLVKFLDRYLFRLFLGRYNLYKKISNKIENMFT